VFVGVADSGTHVAIDLCDSPRRDERTRGAVRRTAVAMVTFGV
jgi:hypothetical protein